MVDAKGGLAAIDNKSRYVSSDAHNKSLYERFVEAIQM
jgi:hypothetical protein